MTKRPWLWRAIPAWARPRCWPAPWTSASSLCSPTSPAAPALPCTGASRGRPPRTSSGCSPIGSAPASPAAPGTQSSSPLTSIFAVPHRPPEAVRLQRGGRPLVRPRRGVFGLPGGVSRLRGGRRPRSCGRGGGAPAGPGLPPGEHRLPPAGGQAFLSREDWRQFAAYLFLHRENKGTSCQSASNMV